MFQRRVCLVKLIIYLVLIICCTGKALSLTCYDCVGYAGGACDTNPESVNKIHCYSHQKNPISDAIQPNLDSFTDMLISERSSIQKNNLDRSDFVCVTIVSKIPGHSESMIARMHVPVEQTCAYTRKALKSKGYIVELCDACNINFCNSNSLNFFK